MLSSRKKIGKPLNFLPSESRGFVLFKNNLCRKSASEEMHCEHKKGI